jgi:hypothetical protein
VQALRQARIRSDHWGSGRDASPIMTEEPPLRAGWGHVILQEG